MKSKYLGVLIITLLIVVLGVDFIAAQQTQPAAVVIPDAHQDTAIIPGTTWHVHDGLRPQPRVVTPGAAFSQLAAPPSDAVVLFNGTDLSKWQRGASTDAATWKVQDGYVEAVRGARNIRTRDRFADFQLHLEFATPVQVSGRSQGRGNSGLLINGMYEVQILDSYNNPTYPDGQAGALYGQAPPLVNASKPPGEWQCYDVVFESPRWNEAGELVKKANVTLMHNGVLVQHKREFIGSTDGIGGVPHTSLGKYGAPHPPEVFIELQDHNNPVRYRNIWIRTIGE